MRFASYETEGKIGLALLDDATGRGLHQGQSGFPGDLDALLACGADLAAVGRALRDAPTLDETKLTWLPPLRRPGKILCVGLNYADHMAETGAKPPVYPNVFVRFASSLIGPGAAIVKPAASDQVDYEAELAVIIGRGGRHIDAAQALGHVAGYACFNDVSVRDFQKRTTQWTLGKNFDATGAFGPCLVTPDELPPGGKGLAVRCRLNGALMQNGNTASMVFDVPALIALISAVCTLAPGDVLITGTPGGVGFARTPPVFMKPGDVCEIEIERLGTLRNPVVAEAAVTPSAV